MPAAPFQYATELRQAIVIAGAMLLAVIIFIGIAVMIPQFGPQPGTGQLISLLMAGLAVVLLLAMSVLASTIADRMNGSNPAAQYVTLMIIRFSLCEGACFGNVIAYLTERQWWSLAIAGGLIFCMLLMFPTQRKFEEFIETQQAFQ
jgi:hypothetical protein